MDRLMSLSLALLLALSLAGLPHGTAWAQPFGIGAQQVQQGPLHGSLCAANGRFVFGQISDSGKDQFMLDTLTGRLWRIAERGDIGLYLTRVPYRTQDGKTSPFPEQVPCPKQKRVEQNEGSSR